MNSRYPIRPIGDVLSLEYGKPLSSEDRTSEAGIPAYGANGVLCWSKKAFRTNPSIIVGRKGSAGEVNLTRGAFWPTDVTYFIEHDEKVTDLKYLFYLLRFLDLPKLAKGVKPGINRNDVYSLAAPIPSLEEQEQIVAILDAAFEGISKAAANAEKKLIHARELFQSCLGTIFAEAAWPRIALEEAVEADCFLSYGIVQPGAEYSNGLRIVRPTDLGSRVVYAEGLKSIDPALARSYARTTLKGGDLLLCVRGATGVVSIAADELRGANVTRGIVPIRFKEGAFDPVFAFFALLSQPVQLQISGATYGAALMQINIRDVRKLAVPAPPLDVQRSVSERLRGIDCEVLN